MGPGLALRRRRSAKTALVLGAGGVLGAAWMTGALPALQERLPCAVNDADFIIGTSAGSVLAAALRCRVALPEMIAYQRGEAVGVLRDAGMTDVTDGPWPPRPRLQLGSPRLMLNTLLRPHRIHPAVGASAWLPRGRGTHAALYAMVDALHRHAHRYTAPGGSPPEWVDGGQTWIVAVDYDAGRRVIFGRAGAPPARLPDAVIASCSVPGWYEPVVIGGRRYVDGGVRSPTSLGVLARTGVDEVHVLAPMASTEPGPAPRKPHERLERRLRALATSSLRRDAEALRRLGIRVTVLTPGPEDLAVMGVNLMDPRRRRLVLETSLQTSPAALAGRGAGQQDVA